MNKPRISIIIPAYNEERYLGRCLDSIAAQALQPYEVVVVDNGSVDKTALLAAQYPFVTLIHEGQRGRVYARNAGFEAAMGDILARIDADAQLPTDWTACVSAYFEPESAKNTAWTGGALFYNVRFPRLVSGVYDILIFRFNAVLAGHPTLWGSNMAMPRELWQEVAGRVCLRNDIHEDLDLAIHLHQAGRAITYDKRVKVHVQMRRVRSNRHELWSYLQMWPRTLRVHRLWTWPICWLLGCLLLYLVTPLLTLAEKVARMFGKQPLED